VKAKCRVSGEEVAVKTVAKAFADRAALAQLADEIRIMHRLRHPNVRALIGYYEDESHLHIVSDLCKGGELFDRIAGRGHLTERECARLVRQILSALVMCHDAGVVHRDIKPENLLFRTPRSASAAGASASAPASSLRDIVLVDFGLAHLASPSSSSSSFSALSSSDTCAQQTQRMHGRTGSPYYMAPECVRGEQYGSAVDVWAVGAVTFQCLTGYPPFLGDDPDEIFQSILQARVRYDWPEFEECGDLAVPFLQSLLTPDPVQRPTAAEALRHPWLDPDLKARDLKLTNSGAGSSQQFETSQRLVREGATSLLG
jgi:serine/threonine protein kinase